MRIAIITSQYPSEQNPYPYAFVHTRVKAYVRRGEDVNVLVPALVEEKYVFEGVEVHRMPVRAIRRILNQHDVVMLHLLHISHVPARDGSLIYEFLLRESTPTMMFIHGVEVQRIAIARRDQIVWTQPRSLAVWWYHDFFQIPKMKRYLQRFLRAHPRARFVAVSRWMLEEVRRNLNLNLMSKAVIIPNGIDPYLFLFKDRWKARHRLLTIRPLVLKGKYAVDLALETMRHVSPPINLDIYGRGPDAQKVRNQIHALRLQGRVRLSEGFFSHAQLPDVYDGHGIYYAVTRMDAQGVSMCEAMASGMPVVSFDICGIPEFVQDGLTGLLIEPYNTREAADAIQALVEDQNLYRRLAVDARRFAESISIERTTARELAVARELL